MAKKYIQIELDSEKPEDKQIIDHLKDRYPHLKPGQVYKELMKRDMEERNR